MMSSPGALRVALVALPLARAEWTGILGLNFESDGGKVDQRAMQCPSGFITGLTVRHGRDEKDDLDMYDFKLRCGDRWGAWSGMPFKSFKEEKATECPMKMHVTGLEVKQVPPTAAQLLYPYRVLSQPRPRQPRTLPLSARRAGASSATWTRTTSSCSAPASGSRTWT